MTEVVTTDQLPEADRIAEVLAQKTYPGYPEPAARLYADSPGVKLDGPEVVLPLGPWQVTNHANRRGKPAHLLDPELVIGPDGRAGRIQATITGRWQAEGIRSDQFGRPVHPDIEMLLGDPRIGLPTGLGFFWRYGPNRTVDAAVHRAPSSDPSKVEILTVHRRIDQKWALPGGFVDPTDVSPDAAALRELREEAGVVFESCRTRKIMHKRSVGQRDTANAWTENVVIRVDADPAELFDVTLYPEDDVDDAMWVRRDRVMQVIDFDAHRQYVAKLLDGLDRERYYA